MEFFKQNTKIDFLRLKPITTVISAILCLGSLLLLAIHGLNFGLEFTGGTQIQVAYTQTANIPEMRQELKAAGFPEAVLQVYGTTTNVLIRIGLHKGLDQQTTTQKITSALPGATVMQVNAIGASVSQQLATNGALALVLSLLCTIIYIAIRFEWRFAVGAAVALLHDPIIILGVFSVTGMEFDLTALAALLTVIGYSLNDTIVIFDRIRENFRKVRKGSSVEIVNLSINQTLSRTIMTSGLTLLVVIALLFLGGPMIFGFSVALSIGIVVGTYSSIYVAGALAVSLGLERANLIPKPRSELDDRP